MKLKDQTHKSMKVIHEQLRGLKKEVEAKLIESPDDSSLREHRKEIGNLLYVAAGWIDNTPETSKEIKAFIEAKRKLTERIRELIKESF